MCVYGALEMRVYMYLCVSLEPEKKYRHIHTKNFKFLCNHKIFARRTGGNKNRHTNFVCDLGAVWNILESLWRVLGGWSVGRSGWSMVFFRIESEKNAHNFYQ